MGCASLGLLAHAPELDPPEPPVDGIKPAYERSNVISRPPALLSDEVPPRSLLALWNARQAPQRQSLHRRSARRAGRLELPSAVESRPEAAGGGALNLKRRHLTGEQKDLIAVDMLPLLKLEEDAKPKNQGHHGVEGGRGKKKPFLSNERRGLALEAERVAQVAKAVGRSRASVARAKKFQRENKEAAARVKAGQNHCLHEHADRGWRRRAYTLDRLAREFPALLDRVKAGELSVNAATTSAYF